MWLYRFLGALNPIVESVLRCDLWVRGRRHGSLTWGNGGVYISRDNKRDGIMCSLYVFRCLKMWLYRFLGALNPNMGSVLRCNLWVGGRRHGSLTLGYKGGGVIFHATIT